MSQFKKSKESNPWNCFKPLFSSEAPLSTVAILGSGPASMARDKCGAHSRAQKQGGGSGAGGSHSLCLALPIPTQCEQAAAFGVKRSCDALIPLAQAALKRQASFFSLI